MPWPVPADAYIAIGHCGGGCVNPPLRPVKFCDANAHYGIREEIMKKLIALLVLATLALIPIPLKAETSEMRVPLGAGGFGFLPLHMMKQYGLIEKKAAE